MRTVKKILAMMIAIALMANCLVTITIKADAVETGTCGDNIFWELNDWGNLYIYGSGDMPDFSPDAPAPWSYCLPEGQLSVTVSGDVTSIGAYAFYGYTGALYVHMEDSAVMSVGAYAFYDCQNLFEIYLPESVMFIGDYAFYGCCNLMEMPRLDLLMSIGNYAFYGCQTLYAFPFGSSLSTIGDYAFCETYNLSTVTFPATLTYLGDSSFGCCYVTTVTFEGPAPQINRWAFNSTYADAYYDPNQDGWSYFPFQDFDSISWYPIGGGESPLLGTGTCGDNLQWELNQNGVLTISGTGRMTDFLAMDLPWQSFADQITSVVIESGVEYIGREAFRDCTQIISITAESSLLGVGMDAFTDTAWLSYQPEGLVYVGNVLLMYKGTCPAQVTLPEWTSGIGAKAFQNAEALETINFPSGLREIGARAFEGCINLKEIALNEGLVRLGQAAFRNCESVTEILIPNCVTVMDSGVFNSCDLLESARIGSGLTTVSEGTFYGCKSLKEIEFGQNLRSIGITAFYGCTALEQVELPENIAVISDSAFQGCTALKSITMPGVTTINYYAFSGCSALEELEFPETLQQIGQVAFGYCASLKSVAIPDGVKALDVGCFKSCASMEEVSIGKGVSSIDSTAFTNCTALKKITVNPENAYYMSDEYGVLHTKDQKALVIYPVGRVGAYTVADTVTKICKNAFTNCSGLTMVTLPEGLQTLEFGAFSDCTALTEVKLPDSLTNTYGGAFARCTALQTVQIGEGLEEISATTFWDCSALTTVIIPQSVQEISIDAFAGCRNLETIRYTGTREQWETISVDMGNDYLKNATIEFAYCLHNTVENGTCANCGKEAALLAFDAEGNGTGYYFSFADIPAGTKKIALRKDTQQADVVLNPGVELDLNGHTLTVDSILSFAGSAVVDSSEKDTGVLKILDAEGNMLSSENAQLPVFDAAADGLRFFQMNVQTVAVTGKADPKYWFRVTAENFAELYALIKAGSQLNIAAKITWNSTEAIAVANDEFLNQWADKYAAGDDFYITVSAVNTEGLSDFTLTPCVTANGVEICGDNMQ